MATLDRLSGGRMVLGAGLGIDPDFAAFGHPADLRWRAARLDASIDAIQELWTGEPVSRSGEVVLERASVLPRPVQDPLPIWTAIRWPGSARGPIRRAVRAQGVFPVLPRWQPPEKVLSPDDVASLVAALRDEAGGELPANYVVAHGGGSTGPETLEPYVVAGMTYWLESFHPLSHTLDDAFVRVGAGPPG
jgi:alkanesulfonate monooxygenase SsuD/methylene tetrahydromethanopterin reductase-like flavin-dependent oxidoreductase (luciferase family)